MIIRNFTKVIFSAVFFLSITAFDVFAETKCIIDGQATTLADITRNKFTDKSSTLTTFRKMHDCLLENNDRRIVFLDVYWYLTEGLFGLPEKQEFKDLPWYITLLVGTAERYRMAFYQYEIGDFENMPQVWRLTFDSYHADRKQSRPLDLLLGMNSHITYDIALTLIDINTDFSNPNQFEDFRSLNPYFTEITPALWDIVESYENRDPKGQFTKNWKGSVVNRWIIFQRLRTWDRAQEMDTFKTKKPDFEDYREFLDRNAVKRGKRFIFQRAVIK